MWRFVFLLLGRQRGKNFLAGSGFLLAACALILLSATTQTTIVQANQIISQNWRPAYDLVVLPEQSHASSENIVPPDLLSGLGGTISVQQYEQIKQLAGIEAAAPIALLGYVQMQAPLVAFAPSPLPAGYYRVDWTLTSFNGKQSLVEQQESFMYYVPASCDDPIAQEMYSDAALSNALTKQHIFASFCGLNGGPQTFSTIDTGPFLLAAIDPQEENLLVNLKQSVTSGRMLSGQDSTHLDSGEPYADPPVNHIPNYQVPVLLQQQMPGQVNLHASFTRLTTKHIDPQQVLNRGGFNYLAHLQGQQVLFSGTVPTIQADISQIFQEGNSPALYWDGHSWQSIYGLSSGSAMRFLYRPSNLSYRATQAPAGQYGSAYRLIPSSTQNPAQAISPDTARQIFFSEQDPSEQQWPETAFRTLTPLHVAETRRPPYYASAVYEAEPTGLFNGEQIASQFGNPLNWLPESTYSAPPTILTYNAQGHPVTAVNLLPTTNPTGFTIQPPLMLTTLTAAQRVMGGNIISAIRLRVSGVEAANPASWKRVQQVAQEIHDATHLQVLVTLGSSPRPMLVYVPGIQQGQFGAKQTIAPIGWVEERWIAIGASILYLTQLGATRLLLLAAVLAVCLGYLVVAFSALVTSQRTEFAVLSALGWRPGQTTRLFLMQALLLALGGGIAGMALALVIVALLGAVPIWLIVAWTLPAMLVLAFISALYPLWQLWRISPAEILRAGSAVSPSSRLSGRSKLPFRSAVSSLGALVVRNLARSRPRTVLTGISLFLSALLLVLMFSGILALHQTLLGTLLGDFVLLQTAVPQIAGCIFAVLLTFLSVADLLLLQVRERQREIGLLQAVGWRTGQVQRLFVQEGLLLAMLSTLPAVLVAQWVVIVQHNAQNLVPPPLLALAAMLLIMLVAALATLPALRTVGRMQVADVLRNE